MKEDIKIAIGASCKTFQLTASPEEGKWVLSDESSKQANVIMFGSYSKTHKQSFVFECNERAHYIKDELMPMINEKLFYKSVAERIDDIYGVALMSYIKDIPTEKHVAGMTELLYHKLLVPFEIIHSGDFFIKAYDIVIPIGKVIEMIKLGKDLNQELFERYDLSKVPKNHKINSKYERKYH